MTYADRSGAAFWKMGSRTTHADAPHQADRRAEAETRFREAEQIQKEMQPDSPLLYSLRGFQYCALLLAAPERAAWQRTLECGDLSPLSAGDLSPSKSAARPPVREPLERGSAGPTSRPGAKSGDKSPHSKTLNAVSQRAAQTLKIAERNNWLLDIALDHLTLGRAALYAAILDGAGRAGCPQPAADNPTRPSPSRRGEDTAPYLTTARREVNAAVSGLRRAGTQDHLPRALLTRAWLRFLTGVRTGPASAQEDLDEAWEIAERGPMKLHMADIHLYRARLFGSRSGAVSDQSSVISGEKYPWTSPATDLAAAAKLIHACGYHRRNEELAGAKRAIFGSSPPT